MNPEQHIKYVLNNKIRPMFEEASKLIEALKVGEKFPATKLAKVVAERLGLHGPKIYPVLLMLFQDYPNTKKSAGAHGGIERLPVKTDNTQPGDNTHVSQV